MRHYDWLILKQFIKNRDRDWIVSKYDIILFFLIFFFFFCSLSERKSKKKNKREIPLKGIFFLRKISNIIFVTEKV